MRDRDKLTNPKDAIGSTKLPFDLVPESATAHLTTAFLEGALKYGRYNWRAKGVRSSIYYSAMRRHMSKWWNGEDKDKKTRINHLASVMACCAIILDAECCDKLNDDRPPRAPVSELIDEFADVVAHLKEMFKDENPHQYTIADSEPEHAGRPYPEGVDPPKFIEFSIKNMDKCESFKELERKFLDEVRKAQLATILQEKFWEKVGDEPMGCHPRAFHCGEPVE
jgi:hypothetical protein